MPNGEWEYSNTKENLENSKTWVVLDDRIYLPSPKTKPKMDAGFYRPVEAKEQVGLEKIDVRFDDLIDLENPINSTLLNDFVTFWDQSDKMKEFGFKQRRGILLYGPPGSGKTSTINLLCRDLIENKNGIVILGDVFPNWVRAALQMIRKNEPDRPLVLLFEDIDTMIEKEKHGPEYLSILDGQDSQDNIVVIATTNYIERLEDRIKDRPGRFDRVAEVGNPNAKIRRKFLEFKKIPEEFLDAWAACTEGYSIAHLKELVIATQVLGEDPEKTFERIDEMKIQKSSDDTSRRKNKIGFGS